MENLAYERIRLFLRTKASDAELKPYVEMAIAAIEARLGKSILHYGEETPRPIAQAVFTVLGGLWGTQEVIVAIDNADGLLTPYQSAA